MTEEIPYYYKGLITAVEVTISFWLFIDLFMSAIFGLIIGLLTLIYFGLKEEAKKKIGESS